MGKTVGHNYFNKFNLFIRYFKLKLELFIKFLLQSIAISE